jgi:hypothetical protein
MSRPATKTLEWSGSTDVPISWDVFVSLFDALCGSERHHLPSYPEVVGQIAMAWQDAQGNTYQLDHLDELREPLEAGRVAAVAISGFGDNEEIHLSYAPGALGRERKRDSRPRSTGLVTG